MISIWWATKNEQVQELVAEVERVARSCGLRVDRWQSQLNKAGKTRVTYVVHAGIERLSMSADAEAIFVSAVVHPDRRTEGEIAQLEAVLAFLRDLAAQMTEAVERYEIGVDEVYANADEAAEIAAELSAASGEIFQAVPLPPVKVRDLARDLARGARIDEGFVMPSQRPALEQARRLAETVYA